MLVFVKSHRRAGHLVKAHSRVSIHKMTRTQIISGDSGVIDPLRGRKIGGVRRSRYKLHKVLIGGQDWGYVFQHEEESEGFLGLRK